MGRLRCGFIIFWITLMAALATGQQFSPFFYLCNYHGQLEPLPDSSGQLQLSVQVEGNPQFYEPGSQYTVHFTSSQDFNGLLITGLFTSTSSNHSSDIISSSGMTSMALSRMPQTTSDFICSTIHTQIARVPTSKISFTWTAPPAGSGCVSFLLTASLGTQLIFSDVSAYQICEAGYTEPNNRPNLAGIHKNGVILRDDFDSGEIDEVFSNIVGGDVGASCGELSHGNSAVFCGKATTRKLVSKPLSLVNASALQFRLGSGSCEPSYNYVVVSYKAVGEETWAEVQKTIPSTQSSTIILAIPEHMKRENVQVQFSEQGSTIEADKCWAIDNVLITSNAIADEYFHENFDPIDTSNWLFMPGGRVEGECMSEGNAMVLSGETNNEGPTYAMTKDFDLSHGRKAGTYLTMTKSGGRIEKDACGHVGRMVRLFDAGYLRQYCTAPETDLSNKIGVRFRLSIGGGNCSKSLSHDMDIELYSEINGKKRLLQVFSYDAYRTVKEVTLPVPVDSQIPNSRICIEQRGHKGEGENVWGIDSLEFIDKPINVSHYLQFSLNLACQSFNPNTSISVEYSTDFGRNWNLLQEECLPETCAAEHWPYSSVFKVESHSGWIPITLPIPEPALSSNTRFRWIQNGPSDETTQWAIDNIYIGNGKICPKMCSGRGRCTSSGCKCDVAYSGKACETTSNYLPSFFSAKFDDGKIDTSIFQASYGSKINYDCGVLATGKALVFNGAGSRMLITKPLNGTDKNFIQFVILMGRHSTTGSCRAPTKPGEGILVHYTTSRGVKWSLLSHIPFDSDRDIKIISLPLPPDANKEGLQIRWWQPRNPGEGQAVWAIDEIIFSTNLFKTITSNGFSFHTGNVKLYCGRDHALVFETGGEFDTGLPRFIETQSMQIEAGYILQAIITLDCEDGNEMDSQVTAQYSTDHGVTWNMLQIWNLPGSLISTQYHGPSMYHVSDHKNWTLVTLPMPEETWSQSLRMRIIQTNQTSMTPWAVANAYVGPSCPHYCNNRGLCNNGVCQCNAGSSGEYCELVYPARTGLHENFNDMDELDRADWNVVGGEIAGKKTGVEGCGRMMSENHLYFFKDGVRKLVSPPVNVEQGGEIQFYFRMGGENCIPPSFRANGILLQYSLNGGVTWDIIEELYYNDFMDRATYVNLEIPENARTKQTLFRWWQPVHGGEDATEWSIDDVIIGEPMLSDDPNVYYDYEELIGMDEPIPTRVEKDIKKAPKKALIILSGDGDSNDFCDPRSTSYVFNKNDGDRFGITDDYELSEGDTLQFQINIDCDEEFSYDFAVALEYSHDGGYSWNIVRKTCYPRMQYDVHECSGTSRELREASIYHKGDYSEWTTVVIPITEHIASERVRFRWIQLTNEDIAAPAFGLDNIYIGKSCPNKCSGFGICSQSDNLELVCTCDKGYQLNTEGSCEPITPHISSGFMDDFNDHGAGEVDLKFWWKRLHGASIGNGCNDKHEDDSLYFGNIGTRRAQTVPLDTRSIQSIEFKFRLGSKPETDSCYLPIDIDDSVIFQYSLDNGITWNLIKTFQSTSPNYQYSHQTDLVRLRIPYHAKSEATSFRWWQQLNDIEKNSPPRAQWKLDKVFFGVSDMLPNSLQDDFEDSLSHDVWYDIENGEKGKSQRCENEDDVRGTSLVFNTGKGGYRFAETRDFALLPGSFLQFDLAMQCDKYSHVESAIALEYSTDFGLSWLNVFPTCMPGSSVGCEHGFGSIFLPGLNKKWTRHTIPLQHIENVGAKIRFRWLQKYVQGDEDTWAIDNIYLGNGCPWMCSGHGRCWNNGEEDQCICDEGFDGSENCEPSYELMKELKDSFDSKFNAEGKYSLVAGREEILTDDLTAVGLIVSGENLQFSNKGQRLLQTEPMNTKFTDFIQFHIQYQEQNKDNVNYVVLQSSQNNGITWDKLHLIKPSDQNTFVNVPLPNESRRDAVVFRLWQTNYDAASGEDIWAIDNLHIGGYKGTCGPFTLIDDFTFFNGGNWSFHPAGTIDSFCVNSGSARNMKFSLDAGEHSMTTKDMCISENYVLQFRIAVGCDHAPSNLNGVRLEYSSDQGQTWQLVQPACYTHAVDSKGCNGEVKQGSKFFPGTQSQGSTNHKSWRRVAYSLDNLAACNSVRFRWYQGFYEDDFFAGNGVEWALDDVYIGPACAQMCNGHGVCDTDGLTCLCDEGYGGPTCCEEIPINPAYFREDFSYNAGEFNIENTRLSYSTGGSIIDPSDVCDQTQFRSKYFQFNEKGDQSIETADLDARNIDFIQFFLRQTKLEDGTSEINGFELNGSEDNMFDDADSTADTRPSNYPVYLQYSNDGGLIWNTFESIEFQQSTSGKPQYVAVSIPENARGNATRFRWWRPNATSTISLSIDSIYIGSNLAEIDDNFEISQPTTWLDMSHATVTSGSASLCSIDSVGGSLEIGSEEEISEQCSKFVSTNGVFVGPGSFLQFSLMMNCLDASESCKDVKIEYSTDFGHTWLPLVKPCDQFDSKCPIYHPGSTFKSDLYQKQDGGKSANRVVIPLPEHSWSPATRFRWVVPDVNAGPVSIDDVYIGSACFRACSGHGYCHAGSCICDEGWAGSNCNAPSIDLPIEVKDIFTGQYMTAPGSLSPTTPYVKVVGAEYTAHCGDVGYDTALHFFGSCSRMLVTKPMNLTKADSVQFMFASNCFTGNFDPNAIVLLQYTTNGGITWKPLSEFAIGEFMRIPRYVNIKIPKDALALGTQLRWWQPVHGGYEQDDWAIDNLIITGKREEKMLSDDFMVVDEITPPGLFLDRKEDVMWSFYDNTELSSFCGRDNVILGGKKSGFTTIIGTKDFIPKHDFIFQYTIVVLCKDFEEIPEHNPVHVQYSTDLGKTWHYLVKQCTPAELDCYGKDAVQPSAHFITADWRRRTIKMPKELMDIPVRFRFYQRDSDVIWAIDRLYIGPTCDDACSGHGDCIGLLEDGSYAVGYADIYNGQSCICDEGYAGDNCYLNKNQPTYLKDNFNKGYKDKYWNIVEGEKLNTDCGVLSDGETMKFDEIGPRQAETIDLDLRDATFVQYKASIGSTSLCKTGFSRADDVLLQYSIDGGITWHLIYSMDYSSFNPSWWDYHTLPLKARTNSTRLRWWQAFHVEYSDADESEVVDMTYQRADWALEDVYIGGHEVNTYEIQDDFEDLTPSEYDQLADEKYGFYPNMEIGYNLCFSELSRSIMFPKTTDALHMFHSLTTREMIVAPGHVIQFKIRVGCDETDDICKVASLVKLSYTTDQHLHQWKPVLQRCFPRDLGYSNCRDYTYHEASEYKINNYWKRITIPIDIMSSHVQFRWEQHYGHGMEGSNWALDDLYIGEACPNHCSGHGQCTSGAVCVCDEGYEGNNCRVKSTPVLYHHFTETFERGYLNLDRWLHIRGGSVTLEGCSGPLRPMGFRYFVHFNRCGERILRTREIDLSKAWEIQYVLQIGSNSNRPECSMGSLYQTETNVVLQYSTNNGITWKTIREHSAIHFNRPNKISARIPYHAKTKYTTLRWWQPEHGGVGFDLWSIDNVEIIWSRQNLHLNALQYISSLPRGHGLLETLKRGLMPQSNRPPVGENGIEIPLLERLDYVDNEDE